MSHYLEQTMKPTITLLLIDGCWMAKCSEPQILDIFGTDTIPTPFTSAYPMSAVLANISALNPHAVVGIGSF
jgi:hypothetical protein